jgi:predicted ATPase/DNA-binding NarL/FixJ family response regulator
MMPDMTHSGTATFLSTGVERSEPLWEMAPDAAAASIEKHAELVAAAVRSHGGSESDGGQVDGVLAVFGSTTEAAAAALAIQRDAAATDWPDGLPIRIRIGIFTGELRGPDGRDQTRSAMARCAGLRDVAHGGQIVLSAATANLVADALPEGAWLDELGVHRLRDLSRPEPLFGLCHGELRPDFPPPRSLDVLPNNLPTQLTSFVGRDDELAAVEGLLREQRLVTLSGAGGCGKTRLAVQAAAGLADRWLDGTWWIDLGSVSDPALLPGLAASAVGVLVEPAHAPLPGLIAQLRGRRLLLCVDTCEHLLDPVADLVDAVLRACPQVSILATSREPLGVEGEAIWRVPSMAEDEAVRLFADRAALVRPGFVIDAEGEEQIRGVCRRVDGIPLAIELAAAWIRVLTPHQIAAGLDDRFQLLAGGPRGAIARQQTLAASMEWSHDLLDDVDRRVFRRLSVFTGGFTLEAAQTVGADDDAVRPGDVLPVLGRLVDKSLVVMREGLTEARYRLLDTVREYGMERLATARETESTSDRHLDYFLELAETAEPELERDQDTWRHVLDAEHDNLRSALRWGLDAPDPERGRRLAAALARYWFICGRAHEGLQLLNDAIERAPGDRSLLQARLLCGAAMVGEVGGRLGLTVDAARQGLELAIELGDDRIRGRCLLQSAYHPFYFDFARAEELAHEATEYGVKSGDPYARDHGQLIEACALTNRDRHEEAVALARPLRERSLARGDRFCASFSYSVEVWAGLFTGDLRQAVELGHHAVRTAEPLADYFTTGTNTTNLAWVLGVAGELDEARRLMDRLVRSIDDAGPDVDVVGMGVTIGKLHLWGGDLQGAIEWFERCTRFAAPDTDNWIAARGLPGLAGSLRRLGRPDEARAHAERGVELARRLEVPHVLAESLDELARLTDPADIERAQRLHHEALAVRVERGLRTFYVDSLEALATLAARRDSQVEAVRLVAACDSARERMGNPRPAIEQADHDAVFATVRAALSDEAWATAWAEGAELDLDGVLSYATRARGARDRPATGWASLTPSEREVVRLVVDGLSNPEIASRLFVSRATVKTHLSHVYAKVGVANRTELAALATEQDR